MSRMLKMTTRRLLLKNFLIDEYSFRVITKGKLTKYDQVFLLVSLKLLEVANQYVILFKDSNQCTFALP